MRRFTAGLSGVLLVAGAAAAVTATPAGATAPGLVNANPAPAWQTNGAVEAIAVTGGVVYVGGTFTSVRPPGDPAGTGEVPRDNVAAFDAATGDLLPWAPTLAPYSAKYATDVYALTVSPDGATLYMGGDFFDVNGVKRPNVAAFSTATGNLTGWAPKAPNGQVKAVAVGPDGTVYVGGRFTSANNQPRTNLAAYTSAGAALPWAPEVDAGSMPSLTDGAVHALLVSPDGSEVVLGGDFENVNGVRHEGIEAVDPVTGANMPAWGAGPQMSQYFTVFHMTGDAQALYFGGVDNGGRYGLPEFDGTAALNWADGSIRWRDNCAGDTEAVALVNGVLYSGSHVHDCSAVPGGFGSTLPVYHHLLAESSTNGAIQPWWPNTDAGSSEGDLGPAVMATDGSQLFVGGTFTQVNNQPAYGFARFTTGPDNTPPSKPGQPSAVVVAPGTVQLSFTASADLDDSALTYSVYRDYSTLVGTFVANSEPWSTPELTFTDSGVPAGTHFYQVTSSDGTNTSYTSDASNSVDATGTAAGGYSAQVLASAPWSYWRLGDAPGSTTATDATGSGHTGTYGSGVTLGSPGALTNDPDTAATFNGGPTGVVTGNEQQSSFRAGWQTFSLELWFHTTTTRGGRLIGFSGKQTGLSGNYDRHIYMTNNGNLVFGVYTNRTNTIRTTGAYNDGNWHHVVATLGSGGMAFYVDGQLVGTLPSVTSAQSYSGYWRLGGDNLAGWPSAPASNYFAGTLDEGAIYPYTLSGAQVSAHYSAGAAALACLARCRHKAG